jgi:integrase
MKLEKRPGRDAYYVRIGVPRDLQRLGYRSSLRKSTKTANKREAQHRSGAILADLRQQIELMYREAGLTVPEWQTYRSIALEIRERAFTGTLSDDPEADPGVAAAEVADHEQIGERFGDQRKLEFVQIAEGKQTPLDEELIESCLSDSPLTDHTRANYRPPIREFIHWCGGSVTVEEVTRRMAGRYVVEHLQASGAQPATINKKLSGLSTLWGWMVKRGYTTENPWEGQKVAKKKNNRGKEENSEERPLTDQEVATLLRNAPEDEKGDFFQIVLLTGMRRSEAVNLRVDDCGEDWVRVREGKSKSAIRTVPLHRDLQPMIARRCQSKSKDALLFDDLYPNRKHPGQGVTRWFTEFRRSLNIKDPGAGRRERVNLHSARRWFITKAEEAGHPLSTIALIAGHDEGRSGMTAHYSGGPGWQNLKAVVESVKLPA